jgi:hypothetical protein
MADRKEGLRRAAAGVLAGFLLALAACGADAPTELEPAERGARQCPSLTGIWDLSSVPGLARAFPGDPLPAWLADSVAAARIAPAEGGRIVIDFLADADAIVVAAEALRSTDPAGYARWRKRVEADAPDEAIMAEGPVLSLRRTLGDGSCTDGWLSLGYSDRAADEKGRHLADVALSRNQAGALLVRRHYSQTKTTGFVFFGQRVTYERDAGSNITLLAPRVDAQELSMRRLRDLPLGVDPAALSIWRTRAPDRLVRINARILASLPIEVIPAEFEVLNLDVTHAKAVPDHFRITMAATFQATTRGDLLLAALQVLPEVSGLELVSQEDAGQGRRRTAVVFEYRD